MRAVLVAGSLVAFAAAMSAQSRLSGTPYVEAEVKIELERSCAGSCPLYRLAIGGDGSVEFVGEDHVQVRGVSRGQITREEVADLVNGFLNARFFDLPTNFQEVENVTVGPDRLYRPSVLTVVDGPSTILSLTLGARTHRIRMFSQPADLKALAAKIDTVAGSSKWIGQ